MAGLEITAAADKTAMDSQHHLQLDLVRSLRTAIAEGRPKAESDEILDMLVRYSESHFMAEQLIMRLHAYPEYQRHQLEHDRSMEVLEEVKGACAEGKAELTDGLAEQLEILLLAHFGRADQALADFLAGKPPPETGRDPSAA